ncbi:MAG: tetratricopeptide repeat protein [Candidatus Aminicenantes bacterium]|nr:tetratricopeptide repeat protein [Candidatus Aminicenantes bacterium]HHF51597.1 tetratricopeptide repeat protein [Candidatus Aminicenantes bacterium]
MSLKKMNPALIAVLAVIIVFASVGCEKLKVNKLQANHYFIKANQAFSEQKYRDAIENYEKALELNPNLVQAHRFLGESYKAVFSPGVETERNMERADKALEALKKAYEISPENEEIIHSLADMYDKLRNFEEAEKLFLKILEMNPTNMSNYYVVAEFYKKYAGSRSEEEEGEKAENGEKTPFEKAEQMYLRRIELDPENPQGYAYIAQFYEDLEMSVKRIDQAYFYHDKRTDLEPDNPAAWLSKGVNRWSKAYRLQNRLSRAQRLQAAKESESALLKASELDPKYPEPYSWLSVIYQSVLAKIDPDRAQRYIQDGQMYIERYKEAREAEAERQKLAQELKK